MSFMDKPSADKKMTRCALTGICAGSNVRTPFGARRIEHVRPGDLIVTRNNGLQPVKLVWTRTISAVELTKNPSLAPIRLNTRAIGPMMPARPLRIAPGHRALIPGYRVADVDDKTSYLMKIDGVAAHSDAAYVDRSEGDVTYYNLIFEDHQIFCVEGLPVESLRPSPKLLALMDVATRAELRELFPNLAHRRAAFPAVRHPVARAKSYLPDHV